MSRYVSFYNPVLHLSFTRRSRDDQEVLQVSKQ
jgi:hypothetical protein